MRMRTVVCALVAMAIVAAAAWPTVAEEAKADGKSMYGQKCAMCHGTDGVAKAMGKGSANFNDPGYAATPEEIVKITLVGKGKMPKFEGKLSAEQAQTIAEYVKTLAPKK